MPRKTIHQFRRYLDASLWVLRDGLRNAWWRVIVVAVCDAAGVAGALFSVGLLVLYAQSASRDEPMEVMGFTIETAGGGSAWYVSGVTIAIGLTAAVLLYIGQFQVQAVARHAQRRGISRILRVAGRRDLDEIVAATSRRVQSPVSVIGLATSSTKYAAFALRSLVRAILPVIYTIVAVVGLFLIDTSVTLLLGGVAVVYMVPLVVINRNVARHHRVYRETVSQAMGAVRQTIQASADSSGPATDESVWGPAVVDSPAMDTMQHALFGRLLAAARVGLLNGAFFAICLFIIFVQAIAVDNPAQADWGMVLIYVVGLRFAWQGVKQVTLAVTKASRFFPEYEVLAAFLQVADGRDEPALPAEPLIPLDVEVGPDEEGIEAPDIELEAGSIIAVLSGDADESRRLHDVALAVAGSDAWRAVRRHASVPLFAGVSALDQAGGPGAEDDVRRACAAWFERMGVLDEIRGVAPLDEPLADAAARSLSADAVWAITTARLVAESPAVVIVPLASLRLLSAAAQVIFLEALPGITVLVGGGPRAILGKKMEAVRNRTTIMLLADGPRFVLGIATEEIGAQQERIVSFLDRTARSATAASGGGDLIDDLDEDL